jgi:hypothetical protein
VTTGIVVEWALMGALRKEGSEVPGAEPVAAASCGFGVGVGEVGGVGLCAWGHVRGDYALVRVRVLGSTPYTLFMVSRVGWDWRVERLQTAVSMRVPMALA